MAALGIGATVIAVPRALSGIVAVPQGAEAGISRTAAAISSSKPSTAKMPVWSAPPAGAPDTRPPAAVTGLRLLTNSESTIALTWVAAQDNVGVKLYVVKGDGFPTVQTTETKATVSWPHRTATVAVQVAAVDTSGNQGEWRTLAVTPPLAAATITTAPAAPAPTTAPAPPTDPVVTTAPPTSPSSPDSSTTAAASTEATPVQTAAVVPSSTATALAEPSSAQSS